MRIQTIERAYEAMMDKTMTNHNTTVLIVAQPGRRRSSLRTLVMSMPQVTTVNETADGSSALRTIMTNTPALILLDTNLDTNLNDQTWIILNQIKTRHPQTKCVVLADNFQQQRQAEAAGADNTLLKGFQAQKLFATLERLLAKQSEAEEGLIYET